MFVKNQVSLNILLLSMYYKPDTAATGLLMAELAEELTEMGHKVTVVAAMPHYDTNAVWPEYRGKAIVREKVGNVDVVRLGVFVPKHKDKVVGRFLSYILFTLFSAYAACRVRKPDVILTCSPSPPLTNGIAAFCAARWRHVPFIFNIQDMYPDVAIRLGLFKSKAIVGIFKAMERFVYKRAEAITVLSEGFQRNLREKGVPGDKISVIPNFVDIGFVTPQPRHNAFSAEHGWNDKFVVLFAGNVGMSQGLEMVLETAQKLEHLPDLLFMIVGNGASKPYLEQQAREMKLTNLRFLPYQPYSRVPELYSASDVCLIPLRKGFTEDSVPSKLFTIMAVARPVIAAVDSRSDTGKVVRDGECGLCIPPEDADEMAKAVMCLYKDREEAKRLGENGHDFVQGNYTRQAVAQRYQELFSYVTRQPIVEPEPVKHLELR